MAFVMKRNIRKGANCVEIRIFIKGEVLRLSGPLYYRKFVFINY